MGVGFLQTASPLVAAALYLLATAALFRAPSEKDQSGQNRALAIAGAGALLHAVIQARAWTSLPLGEVDTATVLSLCTLVVVALWASSLLRQDAVPESGLIALPLAALANIIDALFSGPYLGAGASLHGSAPGTLVHIVSSVIAFGMLSLAGTYAILVLAIDHSLKRHELSTLVRRLPPLDRLEGLLFRLVATGFALLTISLASGLIYVDNLLAQHLVHKTIFAFLAWLVFGALLVGRWLWGWRGATAVRMTLAGVALLLLSYFGSKLVLEVILGRSWYS